ncbi:DNA polymerase III, delta subunit [Bacteroidales bacterium 6E]|nr:DNA polymerase III, delta subunit [Bacteroidales bacterium 6E]
MFFKDIIGQSRIKERLIRSVHEERISHAQLFSGPEGNGKLALALAYAQYISCRNRSENDSCGGCPSCRKYQKLQHPDLHFVFPIFKPKGVQKSFCDDFLKQWREMVLKSPYFGLNQWGSFIEAENSQLTIYSHESESIIRKLNIKPFEAEFKVMIIWLPEKMNIACSNKLLKMIEEPPVKTLFLMVTENEADIISTIRSRTQIIKIPRISDIDLQEYFAQTGLYDAETIAGMIHHAGGNYLKAIEFSEPSDDKKYFFDVFQNVMRHAYSAGQKTSAILEILDIAEELAGIGRERQKDFFMYAMQLTREFFMMNLKKPALVYLNQEEKSFGDKFAPFINERNVILFNNLFEEGYLHISRNGNPKIVFTDTLLSIIRIIKK